MECNNNNKVLTVNNTTMHTSQIDSEDVGSKAKRKNEIIIINSIDAHTRAINDNT